MHAPQSLGHWRQFSDALHTPSPQLAHSRATVRIGTPISPSPHRHRAGVQDSSWWPDQRRRNSHSRPAWSWSNRRRTRSTLSRATVAPIAWCSRCARAAVRGQQSPSGRRPGPDIVQRAAGAEAAEQDDALLRRIVDQRVARARRRCHRGVPVAIAHRPIPRCRRALRRSPGRRTSTCRCPGHATGEVTACRRARGRCDTRPCPPIPAPLIRQHGVGRAAVEQSTWWRPPS